MDVTIELHRPRICTHYNYKGYRNYKKYLLRLSNCVEENPGPTNIVEIVDSTLTVCEDYNQGNELKFGSSVKRQCIAMSLCAIVYK